MLLKQEEADGGLRGGRRGYLDVIGQGKKEQAANELCRMFSAADGSLAYQNERS
jgi:hypothetical protein